VADEHLDDTIDAAHVHVPVAAAVAAARTHLRHLFLYAIDSKQGASSASKNGKVLTPVAHSRHAMRTIDELVCVATNSSFGSHDR
jgi:hypothetical protein